MSGGDFSDIQKRVQGFAKSTEAPEDSFLHKRFSLSDREAVQSIIDGMTLSLISFCYHRHPRGLNVHEVMEQLERAASGSDRARELEELADEAAALQIPFIVNLNRLVEEYYQLRRELESALGQS